MSEHDIIRGDVSGGADEPKHLVVVASSAGGIEALSALIGNLSHDFPAPVVLAHLDPTSSPQVAALERKTRLPVVAVAGDTRLEKGKLYLVPSNQRMVIRDGHIVLEGHHGDDAGLSMDLLLASATRAYGDRLIAVVLTGSGMDSGASEAKSAGRVTLMSTVPEDADDLRRHDEFLSLASHELRTPLAPLSAYVEVLSRMLEEKNRDPAREMQLQRIVDGLRKQVRQMSRLTDDLLDISRLRTGKFTIELKPIDFRRIVDDAFERATLVSSHPPIRLDYRLNAGVRVMADEMRLSQMIHNLLSNAIRHARESEWVDLRVEPIERDGRNLIRIEVQDYGLGVPMASRKGLFTRFFQSSRRGDGRPPLRAHRTGLGLGLYISRQIAEQHGGRIGAQFNEPGTTFWVEIPQLEG